MKPAKAAQSNTWAASNALYTVLDLLQDETSDLDPADPDYAEDQADVATLGQIRDLLTGYIASTAAEVGTPDDLADLADEQGGMNGMMAGARSATKSFAPHALKLGDAGTIELAFSQLNVVDSDGDVTLPGAFPVKDVPLSAYGHTSWDGALPVGKGTISEVAGWGVFKGAFFMNTTAGKDTFATLKGLGPLAEYSYGYKPLTFSFGQKDGQQVRFLKTLDVFEVSPVLKGAGLGTHTLAMKSGAPGPDVPYAEHASWVRDAVKALLARTTDRALWRAKEGRVLSSANRDALGSILESLRGFATAADELETILASTDPAKAERLRKATLTVLLADAQRYGIPV